MARRSFLDTNVLIYSVDSADSAKQTAAIGVIERHALGKSGVISTQVLQEFYSAATRKLGIEPLQARRLVRDFWIFDIVQVTPEIIEEGIDCGVVRLGAERDRQVLGPGRGDALTISAVRQVGDQRCHLLW